ncbi:MAG: sporulation peptidase YabG [Bacilli bacterium]|nr:sporulation peptidase YabG [Bacilli bacterium]
MEFKVGDIVTRNSYQNDLIFKIVKIESDIYYLAGINIRLCADAIKSDLKKYEGEINDDIEFLDDRKNELLMNDEYFYLPGKILHIDSDTEYLDRCMKYYNSYNLMVAGILQAEQNLPETIESMLKKYNPNIVVITGHDAYYNKKNDIVKTYKNSLYYIEAVKKARNYENSHQKLIIVAGGCQSNYEELIKAGANFASSPKRINIHALDPAIVAAKLSMSDITKDIDLKGILENTKYGSGGIGGIKTKGTMYIGYPR